MYIIQYNTVYYYTVLYAIGIHYTLYTVYTIHYTVYSIQCVEYVVYIVQVWTVDPTEILINAIAIAIMTPGKSNRQPIQYTV